MPFISHNFSPAENNKRTRRPGTDCGHATTPPTAAEREPQPHHGVKRSQKLWTTSELTSTLAFPTWAQHGRARFVPTRCTPLSTSRSGGRARSAPPWCSPPSTSLAGGRAGGLSMVNLLRGRRSFTCRLERAASTVAYAEDAAGGDRFVMDLTALG